MRARLGFGLGFDRVGFGLGFGLGEGLFWGWEIRVWALPSQEFRHLSCTGAREVRVWARVWARVWTRRGSVLGLGD